MKWFYLVLFCTANSHAYNILCLLPYPGKSHHMMFEPLLDELVLREHNLTVVSFFPRKQPQVNRRDVSLAGLVPISLEVVDLQKYEKPYFDIQLYYHTYLLEIVNAGPEICERIINAHVFKEFINADGNYDVILVEHFMSNCMFGVIHKYGLPSIGLSSSCLLPFTLSRVAAVENPAFYPMMVMPSTDKMTFWERVKNIFLFFFSKYVFDVAKKKEQDVVEKRMGRKLPLLEDIARNSTSALLVNTYPILNGIKVFPPAVVEIGGIHLHNRTVQLLLPELEKWVNGAEEGVILFSFGSMIRGSTLPRQSVRAIVRVFARLPQRVLWKWEGDEIEDLPPNVRLIRWLPQYDLLHHPKCVAFITHAGLLSLTEATSAGVPVLTVPVLGDQFGNAAHAERAGIAKVLQLWEFQEERLQEALNLVLSKEMRARAKRVSAMWASRPVPPMALAVHHVEWAARFGGPHLSSHARHLTFYQLALLDVMAFLIAIVALPVAIVTFLCKRSKRKLKRS